MKNIKTFAASTAAQAFAIGAVLIITIAVTATTAYIAINAPIETKKCEFVHSTEVSDDFAALHSSMSSLIHSKSAVAYTSVPIKMTPTKESIIALPLSSGSLTFSPDAGKNITVRLCEPGGGTNGTWNMTNFSTNYSVIDGGVNVTSGGNITLAGPPYASATIVSDMTNLFGHVGNDTGTNSTVYGNVTWHEITSPPATEINMQLKTSIFPDMTHATDWLEVENGENLSSRLPTLNGHRYVQFRAELITWEPSETPTLVNVSIEYSSPPDGVVLARSSGSITFQSNYHYLPNHVLTYENGAVIKSQSEGGYVVSPFNFSARNTSAASLINMSIINISIVDLTGENVTHSGAPTKLVRILRRDQNIISDSFIYSNLTLNIYSAHPYICSDWFNKTLDKSNITDYKVIPGEKSVTVNVNVSDLVDGVKLYLEKTTVGVTI